MVKISVHNLTLEEFLQLPETKPASEYIDGEIIQKPIPQGQHSTLQGELVSLVNGIFKPQKIARAFPELRCTFGGRSIVPDVTVFKWERIPLNEKGRVANIFPIYPDWTIEILSPDQSITKINKNIVHCLKHGSSLVWLINAEEESVLVYPPYQTIEILDSPNQILPVPDFLSNLQLTVGELFSLLDG
jgi:Uma2 family endonuclease